MYRNNWKDGVTHVPSSSSSRRVFWRRENNLKCLLLVLFLASSTLLMMNDNQCHSDGAREKEREKNENVASRSYTLKWIINNNNNSWQADLRLYIFHGKKAENWRRLNVNVDKRMERRRKKSINRELIIFFELCFLRVPTHCIFVLCNRKKTNFSDSILRRWERRKRRKINTKNENEFFSDCDV